MNIRATESILIEASVLYQSGQLDDAETLCREVLNKNPDTNAFSLLGSILFARNRSSEAVAAFEKSLEIDGSNTISLNNFARLLNSLGRYEEARKCSFEAFKLDPDNFAIRTNLIRSQTRAGEYKSAEKLCREAIRLDRKNSDAHQLLGDVLFEQRKIKDAIFEAELSLKLNNDNAAAFITLANIYGFLGDAEAVYESYSRALELNPNAAAHSSLISIMNYIERFKPADVLREAVRWAELYTCNIPVRKDWSPMKFNKNKTLKVGFVSGDFRRCSTAFLGLSTFAACANTDWNMYLYMTRSDYDEMTEKFQGLAAGWRNISRLSDEKAAELIIEDDIDILVDMNGHTFGNRLLLFARKPAPIQVSWFDLVSSTGIKTIDYFLGDEIQSPLDDQKNYSETLKNLPGNHLRYWAPDYAPVVGEAPAVDNGYITFGCFNSANKISLSCIKTWAGILCKLENSKLVLNSKEYSSRETRKRFMSMFKTFGVDKKRINFMPGSSEHKSFMGQYGLIDIALDSSPFSGGLTTCEALYMGVPVVTFPGEKFCSRHSSAHLHSVGLDDWIANDPESYLALAIEKSNNVPALDALRRQLRNRMKNSLLMDGESLADGLTQAFQDIWKSMIDNKKVN